MDFKFSMVNLTSILLISGALSNSLDHYRIRKREDRPLLLPKSEIMRPIKDQELRTRSTER